MGKLKALIFRKDKTRCTYCGKKLNKTELFYYCNSCEKCEMKIMKKLFKKPRW